ncbi:hypothetical protein F4823DRAFT_562965 [Ustulina deusta]|nr:hypothetical protein F4823DRAFT_562965 [Ustulina deusta]
MATDTNKNPILQATTWLLLALSSLVVVFWLLTKFYIKTRTLFVLGDGLMLGSYIFALGESIALIVPSSTAFGRDRAELSEEQLSDAAKIGYARDILFLLCIGFSKLSTCDGLRALSPDKLHHLWARVLVISAGIWTITSVFATAFQCGTSGPWDKDNAMCINQDAFLNYVNITSILIDAALIALPIAIIYPLQMPLRLRLTVISFFSFRIIVIGATIPQLIYLKTLWADNYTLLAFPYYISMQLVLFTSLLAAYIIYFWPFMRSLQSGLMSANASMLTSQYPLTRTAKGTTNSTTTKSATSSHTNRRGYIEITPAYRLAHLASAKSQPSIPPA